MPATTCASSASSHRRREPFAKVRQQHRIRDSVRAAEGRPPSHDVVPDDRERGLQAGEQAAQCRLRCRRDRREAVQGRWHGDQEEGRTTCSRMTPPSSRYSTTSTHITRRSSRTSPNRLLLEAARSGEPRLQLLQGASRRARVSAQGLAQQGSHPCGTRSPAGATPEPEGRGRAPRQHGGGCRPDRRIRQVHKWRGWHRACHYSCCSCREGSRVSHQISGPCGLRHRQRALPPITLRPS